MYGCTWKSRLSSGKRLVKRCLNRLQSLNASLALNGSGETDADHASSAADALEALVEDYDYGRCVWAYESNEDLLYIVSSYALALRRSASSSGASASERRAFARLRSQIATHLAYFKGIWRLLDFALDKYKLLATSLLRSQALRCYAALLAEHAATLAPLRTAASPECDSAETMAVLREVCDMLEALVSPVEKPNPGYDVVLAELCKELTNSRLLEHWARALLLLYFSQSQYGVSEKELAGLTERMGVILSLQGGLCRNSLLSLDDDCLSYLITAHLVRLAAVLDGGTTYGMQTAFAAPLTPSPPLVDDPDDTVPTQDIVLAQSALSTWYSLTIETRILLNGTSYSLHGPIAANGSPSVMDAANRRLAQLQQQLEQLDAQLQEMAAARIATGDAAPLGAGAGPMPTASAPHARGAAPASAGTVPLPAADLEQQKRDCERNIARVRTALRSLSVPPLNLSAMRDLALRLAAVAVKALQAADASEAVVAMTSAGGGAFTSEMAALASQGSGSGANPPQQQPQPQQACTPPRGLQATGHPQHQAQQEGQQERPDKLERGGRKQRSSAEQPSILSHPPPAPVSPVVQDGGVPGPEALSAPPQLHKPRLDQCILMGLKGLMCAREAMWDVGWAPLSETPAAKLAQLEDWWRRVMEFGPLIARRGPVLDGNLWRWVELAPMLVMRAAHNSASMSISLAPSADLTVALQHDYLRVVEQLLRRSEGSRGLLVHLIIEANTFPWRQALAYGQSSQVAGLVSTIAKVVRRDIHEMAAAEVEAAEAEARGPAALQRALTRRREARGQATATLAAATGLLGPEWSVLLIYEYTKLLQQREKEEAAAAAAAPTTEDGPEAGDGASCNDAGAGDGGTEGGGGSTSAASETTEGLARYCSATAEELRRMIARIGQNLSHVAARLLPDVCILAVRLAEATWREDDAGMILTHAWVVANTTAFVELTAVVAAAAAAGRTCAGEVVTRTSGGTGAAATCAARGGGPPSATPPATPTAAGTRDTPIEMDPSVAAAWNHLLTHEARTLGQMHLATYLFEVLNAPDLDSSGVAKQWTQAMRSLGEWAPERLAAVVASLGSTEAVKGPYSRTWAAQLLQGGPRLYGLPGPWNLARGLHRVRQLIGPGGKSPDAALWATVERVFAGGGGAGGGSCVDVGARRGPDAAAEGEGAVMAQSSILERMRSGWPCALKVLVAPEDALAVVPTCGNPACTSLAGDSEAGQRLMSCGRCGGRVQYCSRECQVAHWRAGHKAECGRGGGRGRSPAGRELEVEVEAAEGKA